MSLSCPSRVVCVPRYDDTGNGPGAKINDIHGLVDPTNPNLARFPNYERAHGLRCRVCTMRADIIGHFKACMTEIYLHNDARTASVAGYVIMTESSTLALPASFRLGSLA